MTVNKLTDEKLKEYASVLGKTVNVTMDRPIGTRHPKHLDVIYPINYGYVEGVIGGDGEEQDVYVLDEKERLQFASGKVIAVVHRFDDDECKWVIGKYPHSAEEIKEIIYFQEQFHDPVVLTEDCLNKQSTL